MPPPPRRRPVPNPPTTRPRVAGLRKRPEQGPPPTAPDLTDTPATAAGTAAVDPTDSTAANSTDTTADSTAAANSTAAADSTGTTETAAGDTATAADTRSAVAEPPVLPTGTTSATSTEVSGLIEPGGSVTGDDLAEPAPRPRPTGRRKRAGEAVAPSVLDDDPRPEHPEPGPYDTDGTDWASSQDDRTPAARPGLVLPIALLVLAGLLVGLGLWFQARAGEVDYDQALVDSAGTTEVAGQAREAVEKAFSYNFADVSATEEAANELLVGKAQCQYNAIFGPVRTLAPEQKLVVTVKAVSSGVTSLDGDRATVLLFLDQVTTRTTDNQSGGGIAMMRVGAQRVDGRWKVDNMEMFGQSGDQAAETAKC